MHARGREAVRSKRARERDGATRWTHPDTDMDKGRQPGGGETRETRETRETKNSASSASISFHVGAGMKGAISPLLLTFLRALARSQERCLPHLRFVKESPGQKGHDTGQKRRGHGTSGQGSWDEGCHAWLPRPVACMHVCMYACIHEWMHACTRGAKRRKRGTRRSRGKPGRRQDKRERRQDKRRRERRQDKKRRQKQKTRRRHARRAHARRTRTRRIRGSRDHDRNTKEPNPHNTKNQVRPKSGAHQVRDRVRDGRDARQ